MDIEVLDFEKDVTDFRIGFATFKVVYNEEKWEIFRKVPYYHKEGKQWLNLPKVKVNDQWLLRYDRSSGFTEILKQAVKEIDKYITASVFEN